MELLDCTLRDGGNVLGNGFPKDLTVMMLEAAIRNGIRTIECGNAYGVGAYEADGKTAPLTDVEYMDLIQPYLERAHIGMFMGVKNATEERISLAASKGIRFLRIGANAGDGAAAYEGIRLIKKYNMEARFSMMKGYVLSEKDLAEEAKRLEDCGLDAVTIMDSAGTMLPDEVENYVSAMKRAVSIPVGFHGHNNLGMSAANAIAAVRGGADSLDCGWMGMARSAGNLSIEQAVAVLSRLGISHSYDLLGILHFVDNTLAPAMKTHGFHASLCPEDLVLGIAGCHSNFLPLLRKVAQEEDVDLYRLILAVSEQDRKNPSEAMMRNTARGLRQKV